jgi:hypothetical protein
VEREWQAFTAAVPWFKVNRPAAHPTRWRPPGTWEPATSDFEPAFPRLHALLRAATLTDIECGDERFLLCSWERHGTLSGWLSPQDEGLPPSIHPDHAMLLRSFRGCVEQYNEPDTWIRSHHGVLTATLAGTDASFIEAYGWAFAETGGIPITLPSYYAIAQEGNGNTTLCHRSTGGILLFAPDHAFTHVDVLDGCPEYSLYTVRGAPTFTRWVEAVADQWIGPRHLAV